MDDFIIYDGWEFAEALDCVGVEELHDFAYPEEDYDFQVYEDREGLVDDEPCTEVETGGRRETQQGLRDRGLFREGELEARTMLQQWEANGGTFPALHLPRTAPATELAELYPSYALALQHGARIRMEGRPARPLIARLKQMRRQYGRLVFIRFLHPELDAFSMIRADARRHVVHGSKTAIYRWLGRHARGARALVCVLQRDLCGRVHSHSVLPLAVLSRRLRIEIERAPHGRGGGLCLSPEVHACLIGDTDDDLEGVACYMSKYHDERCTLPQNDPQWLTLADEEAEHKQYGGGEKVSLIWHLPARWRPGHKPR